MIIVARQCMHDPRFGSVVRSTFLNLYIALFETRNDIPINTIYLRLEFIMDHLGHVPTLLLFQDVVRVGRSDF